MKAIIQPREGEMAGYRPCKAQEKVKRERQERRDGWVEGEAAV
jgi:hypothetical protein